MMEPEICRKCGTPRLSTTTSYCVTCGTKFPKDVKYVRESASPNLTPAVEGEAPLPAPPGEAEGSPPQRRRGLVAVAIAAVLALVVGGVLFFNGGKGSAYALQFSKANPGDTYRYHVVMDMDLAMKAPDLGLDVPIKGTTDMLVIFEVISRDGDVATVKLSTVGGTVETNGTSQTLPDFTATMRIAADGRVLDINGTTVGGNASFGSGLEGLGQFTPLLPSSTVKPGDTWTKESEVPFLFGDPIKVTSQNRFERYETIDGTRAALIQSETRTPLNHDLDFSAISAFLGTQGALPPSVKAHVSGTTSSSSTSWVNLPTGRWFKTLGTSVLDVTMEMTGLPAEAGASRATFDMKGTINVKIETGD